MADADARLVLLAGIDETLIGWAAGLATQVGDRFASHPAESSIRAIDEAAGQDIVDFPAGDLGRLLGQVAVALREQVKDAKERAAQMAGMLTFAVSQGLDAASNAAAGVSGGLGLVAAFGADRVKDMAEDHIKSLTEEFAGVKGKKALQGAFQDRVQKGLEDVMAAALWTDPRVRQRLFATPGVTPPDPKFLDADGNLHPPPPGTPDYNTYRGWLETKAEVGYEGLLGMAKGGLEQSGLTTQYYRDLATALFTE